MDSNEPVAWAVIEADGTRISVHDNAHHAAIVIEELAYDGMEAVPLYCSPALTDEEREAVAFMLRHAAVAADGSAFYDSADYQKHHDAVFALLERTQRRS